jgi:hypothetical protein
MGDQRLVDACDDRGRGFERFLVACCFKRRRPHWDAVYVDAVCFGGSFLAVHTFAFSGKSALVRALLACHWHFFELECAAIKAEAPFKLRLGCCDGVRRGYGGSIIHDGPHYLGLRAPFLPQCTEELV